MSFHANRHVSLSLVCSVCLLAFAARPVADAAQGQKAALVTVIADAKAPITDLTARDFIVYDDNTKREVTTAERSMDPLSIVLLVDIGQPPMSTMPPAQDLRASFGAFVQVVRANNPGADIALGEFANASVITVDFGKPADLDDKIAKLYPDQPTGGVLLEALADAGKRLMGKPAPRRAIVSVDFSSPELSGEKAMRPAVQSVHDCGATLWAVSVRGTTVTDAIREEVLNQITKANGGQRLTVADASGLRGGLTAVANSLSSQYIVTFARPSGSPKVTRFETTRGAKVLLSPFMR
jgi:hypothetical protein